jgi:prolipoprotein diacylglyceryltransferase
MSLISEYFFSLPAWYQGITVLLGVGLAYLAYRQLAKASNGLLEAVKDDLFTLHGMVTTIIHVLITCGIVGCCMLYSEYFVDHTPKAATTKQGK